MYGAHSFGLGWTTGLKKSSHFIIIIIIIIIRTKTLEEIT